MLAIIEHGASLHTRSDGPDYVGITVESILGHRCVDFGSSPPQHGSSPLYKKVGYYSGVHHYNRLQITCHTYTKTDMHTSHICMYGLILIIKRKAQVTYRPCYIGVLICGNFNCQL